MKLSRFILFIKYGYWIIYFNTSGQKFAKFSAQMNLKDVLERIVTSEYVSARYFKFRASFCDWRVWGNSYHQPWS